MRRVVCHLYLSLYRYLDIDRDRHPDDLLAVLDAHAVVSLLPLRRIVLPRPAAAKQPHQQRYDGKDCDHLH